MSDEFKEIKKQRGITPEVLVILETIIKFSPAPAWVSKAIEAAKNADTAEEFHGTINEIVAFTPIGGE